MKLWLLFAVRFERPYWGHGLDGVVGACCDEEEARDVADRMTLEYWRAHPDEFAEAHQYELEDLREAWPGGLAEMSDDDVIGMCDRNDTRRVVAQEVALDSVLDLRGLDLAERKRVLVGFAELLRPFNAGAATALLASATGGERR